MINFTEDLSLGEVVTLYRHICASERESEDVTHFKELRTQLEELISDFILSIRSIHDVVINDWIVPPERGVNKGGIRGEKKGGETTDMPSIESDERF